MDTKKAPTIPPYLLLKLGQAYRSMPELDLPLFTIIKDIQKNLPCENISLWLLREEEMELECTHVVGEHAADILGTVMRASKFIKIYQNTSGTDLGFENHPFTEWMDTKTQLPGFDLTAEHLIASPLNARGELLGALLAVNKVGGSPFTEDDKLLIHELAEDIASGIQNTQLYEQQDKFNERQNLLNQISQHLHQTLDIDKLIPEIFSEVNKAINAEAQSIWLVDEVEGIIKCRYATGPEAEMLIGFAVPLKGQSIVGTSVSQKKSIIIKDAQKDKRRARSADEWTGYVTRTIMTVPLVLQKRAIGAIQAVNKRGGHLFNQEDLDLFRAIADSAALAVNNAQLVAELQNSYDLTLEALSAALDLRDHETDGHSRRVVEYTARLAEEIGLDHDTINTIRRGALIHDIGKIGVPDAILLKPGKLNEQERKIIERHPRAGYNMLVGISYLKEEIQIVLCHQEKWDGTGYPAGLKGEKIPLGARLFAIADTFDALTSDRPYRKGRPYEVARQLIEDESGMQFDPRAVEAFLAIPAGEWAEIREKVMEDINRRMEKKKQASREADQTGNT